jgi:HrpA-like RNA helicase
MSGPTLLKAGNLEAVKDPRNPELIYGPAQDVLDKLKPIDYIMTWIEKRKNNSSSPSDRILILQSSTGSGKSTIIPPEYYHRFFSDSPGGDRRNICCTQPRVLTSIDIPNTILKFHTKEALTKAGHPGRTALKMGENIGYQTGVISKKPVRGIIYMTIGVLMQQLNIMSDEEFMAKYSVILLDEVHERSIGTDDVLYAMKRFIERNYKNKNCPFLITMSATFDVWKFTDYLLASIPTPKRYENIIKVKGFTYPIQEFWMDYDSTNYIQAAVDKAAELHEKNPGDFSATGKGEESDDSSSDSDSDTLKGGKEKTQRLSEDEKKHLSYRDILIFVSGAGDLRKIKKKINQLNSSHAFFKKYPVLPVELTSDVVKAQSQDYKNLFEDIHKLNVEVFGGDEDDIVGGYSKKPKGKIQIKKPVRRIIIATNVGETGITIHTLKYVVDTGWVKSSEFNPNFATGMLVTKPVTQGMAIQRRGRAGREAPGFFYPIYTKKTFDAMQRDQYPDIIKDEITLNLLSFLVREVDPENYSNSVPLTTALSNKDWWKKVQQSKIDIGSLDLLDLPSADSLHHSMEKLYILGAIGDNSIPTEIGFIINRFRFVSIENIRTLLAGYAWGASIIDLVNMISILQTGLDTIIPEELRGQHMESLRRGNFSVFAAAGGTKESNKGEKSLFFIADDFVRCMLIFQEFQNYLVGADLLTSAPDTSGENKDEKTRKLDELQKWTEENGLSITGLYKAVELREDIINMLALIGLNPYHNFQSSLFLQFTQGIRDPDLMYQALKIIKQCIYEGYKLNIAIWSPVEKKYLSRGAHIPVDVKNSSLGDILQGPMDIAKYGDTNPRFLVYHDLTCAPGRTGDLYEISTDAVSVLDGFIPMDVNFDTLV